MTRHSYSDEFKLSVVMEYLNGDLGVRAISKKYSLPSKNYITNWINKLKKEGKIPENMARKNTNSHSKNLDNSKKSPYEKELEQKVYELEAKLAFYKKYEELLEESNSKKK